MRVSKAVAALGDIVDVTCFSDRSKPAANLQFFVNDNRVKIVFVEVDC